MSDNRKYYYIKLKEDFFDNNDSIKILESMPDGYIYSNILIKLYLKSLKHEGKLMFNDRIPYSPQLIATVTGHQIGTVEKALQVFKDLELIDVLDNGAIYMLDIQNYIGKSSTEADRQRDYRNRIKKEKQMLGQTSQQMIEQTSQQMIEQKSRQTMGQTYPELEIEIELEKEIELTDKLTEDECNRVDFLKELFASWSVSDEQINHIAYLINEKLPFTGDSIDRELRIYDNLQRLITKAKADNVKYIYRWLEKVIPEVEIY